MNELLDLSEETAKSFNLRLEKLINSNYAVKRKPFNELVKIIHSQDSRKILLVYPPKWANSITAYGENIPLALIHRMNEAVNLGWKTELLDLTKEKNPQTKLIEILKSFQPQIICFSTTSSSEAMALSLSSQIVRENLAENSLILKGGPGTEFSFEEIQKILGANSPIDVFFLGDGDSSFSKLLNAIQENDLETIKNLEEIRISSIPQNKQFHNVSTILSRHFPQAQFISSTNEKAFPIILFDRHKMGKPEEQLARIQTATKCSFGCEFCATSQRLGAQTRKPVEEVIVHIKELLKLRINNFYFEDATFAVDVIGKGIFSQTKNAEGNLISGQVFYGWTNQFLEEMTKLKQEQERKGKTIRFGIQTRIDTLADEKFIHQLAKAGCTNVFLGVETLNKQALIHMHKGTLNREVFIESIFKNLLKNRINPTAALIVGSYTGGLSDFVYTIQKMEEFGAQEIFFQSATIYPGTGDWQELFPELKRHVILSYLCPNVEESNVKSRGINPEDQMQYLIDKQELLKQYYETTPNILSNSFKKINEGHYVRKEIFEEFSKAFSSD
ncbi:MAG: radical SAM protein [archaeon]|nr:radical SAM protein [archaeon]